MVKMFWMIVGATLVPLGYEFLRTKNGVSLRINESGDLLSTPPVSLGINESED